MNSWIAFIIGMLTIIFFYTMLWSLGTVNPGVQSTYNDIFCPGLSSFGSGSNGSSGSSGSGGSNTPPATPPSGNST